MSPVLVSQPFADLGLDVGALVGERAHERAARRVGLGALERPDLVAHGVERRELLRLLRRLVAHQAGAGGRDHLVRAVERDPALEALAARARRLDGVARLEGDRADGVLDRGGRGRRGRGEQGGGRQAGKFESHTEGDSAAPAASRTMFDSPVFRAKLVSVPVADPRPLTGEPLPLDLLNTTWVSGDGLQDWLADERGARAWLDQHGFTDAPATPGPLRETREALRALLLDRDAVAGVNAVLARGGERPVLHAGGTHERRVDAAPEWRVPWTCASATRRAARCPRQPRPGLREPRLRAVVPRHVTSRNAPLVLDGRVREPRQGDPARARESPFNS